MDNIKVSIIVPVYNAEKYVALTMDSILLQDYPNFEVVAINDGSKDNSADILDTYQKKDSRIRVLNKSNTGVSETRNIGIRIASGEYVCFVDADDVILPTFLSDMLQCAEKQTDLVVCGYSLMDKRGRTRSVDIPYHKYNELLIQGNSVFASLMEVGLGISSCMKLIRREMILKNGIEFDSKATFDEDMFFSWKTVLATDSIAICPKELYVYRLTSSSSTMRYHPDLLDQYYNQIDSLLDFAHNHSAYSNKLDSEIDIFISRKIDVLIAMVIRSHKAISEQFRDIKYLCQDERIRNGLILRQELGEAEVDCYLQEKLKLLWINGLLSEISRKIKRIIK